MLRSFLAMCLLLLLSASLHPASAHASWWFWLRQPERHGSRKMAGDFEPIYSCYRNHSRQDAGLLRFVHFARHRHLALAHRHTPQRLQGARHRSLTF